MSDGTQFLSLADKRIAYVDSGAPHSPRNAPTVVFLHGFGASLDFWHNTIPALADTLRVVALDFPGFGHSDSPTDYSIAA